MPSLELILETLERERDRDGTHFESLDTKAGLILGFSSALAALAPNTDSVAGRLTVVLAIIAAALATAAFWPRKLPVLDPGALRRYLGAESAFTKLTIVDTHVDHFAEARALIVRKTKALRFAVVVLGSAGAMSIVGIIGA